ncbi:MAG: InlB B-repeat-containing protein [Fibrobacter sp.]|nr:InlB B-repeat-containing protein [Fibrobacter sp.]
MLFVNKLKVLTLMTCLMLVGQGFAGNCDANYEPPENPVWDGSTKTPPCTIGGYYIIDNAAKLAWYGANYNSGNAKLTADIDLGGHLWIPLAAGKGDKFYGKIFDGQNHIIKNLYVNGDDLSALNKEYAQNLGFVGVLGDGKVLNLVLENVDIQATTNAGTIISNQDNQISVGAVVGWMSDKGTNVVDNCITSGTIKTTGKSQGVGGIVGNAKKGTISNCMSLVEIRTSGSKAYIGGIVGITKTDVTVSSCVYAGPGLTNTGTDGSVGGITGNVWSGTMTAQNSYFEGNLTYNGNAVGGVGKTCNGCSVTDSTVNTSEINEDSIACALNGIDTTTGACKTEPWSVGETSLSLNGYGADGYKIVFDANGGVFGNGKSSKNKFLDGGMAITADEVENPTRENFSFTGWAKTRDSAVPAANLGTVSKSDTVFAVWTPVYTVTFNVAPGVFPESNESEKTKQVISGETITVEGLGTLPTSRCKVYVSGSDDECETWSYFTGWALTAGAPESDSVSLDTVTASDELVLHAVWTDVETYTVTYNANKHGTTTVDYVRVGAGDTVSAPTDPIANDGYVFAGWFTDSNGVNEYEFTSQITQSIILYAKWTLQRFNISYVMNEGTDTGDNPSSYTIDTSFALKAPTDIEGYVFEGWFYDAAFTNKATQVILGSTGDKTFYAKWSKKKYRVMYLADNNSYGSISDQFVEHGSTITLESAGIFRRAGYEQNGWSTTMAGAKNHELGEEVEVVAPITLYPTWAVATYTITYECDGCVNNPQNPTTYTINDKKDIKYPQSREGYDFGGWYKETNYTTKVTQIKKGSYGDLTLYGKWIKVYTLTYELNGGTKANSRTSYTSETETFALGEAEGRDGYSFVGWFDNEDLSGVAVTEIPQGSTGDMKFYAKWIPEVYSIVYHNIEGATFERPNPATYTVDDLPIELNNPTKEGYTFEGWFTDESFTGNPITGIETRLSNGNGDLYAKWSDPIEYAITYVGADDLENPNPTSYTVLENALVLQPVAKSGFKFLGWFNENDELVESISSGSTGDITLTAKWAEFPVLVSTYGGIQIFENEDKTKTAVIDGTSEETVIIPTADNVSVDQVVFNRDFSGGVKSTVMFPFTVSLNDVGGGDFWEFLAMEYSSETGWLFRIKEPDDNELKANKPYIFIADQESKNIEFNLSSSVSLSTDAMNPSVHNGWAFKGVYEKVSFNEVHPEWKYAYGYSGEQKRNVTKGSFIRLKSTGFEKIDLAPMRAYLVYDKSLAKSARISDNANIGSLPEFIDVEIVGKKGLAIGGGVLNTTTGELKMDRWYDLRGRKLNGKPTTQGTYYYNGKRIIVR